MNCPTCPDTTLVMTERSGVEIDYCPSCRGVWLDRGELDKIIERSAPGTVQPQHRDDRNDRASRPDHRDPRSSGDDDWDDDDRSASRYRKKRKRESLLSELFDF
jgi:Zn-finger nucleic acid-binding protein